MITSSRCADISHQRKNSAPTPYGKPQPTLIPTGQTGQASCSVKNRTRSTRLNGADIYVARMGWKSDATNAASSCCPEPISDTDAPPAKHKTGSLHDELTHLSTQSKTQINNSTQQEKQPTVVSSRPCYRCISYMASVGIRRAFWTTDAGTWESAKVRDLVDALDNLTLDGATDAATALSSVFVTKHEVLMLRRTMGAD
jgi:hypothetical protein